MPFRGILSEEMMVFIFPHPISCFGSSKEPNNSLFSAGYWINRKPHSWSDLHQHCSPTPFWAIYILQSDTRLKQHSGCNKTLLKQIKPFLKNTICLKHSINEMPDFLQCLTLLWGGTTYPVRWLVSFLSNPHPPAKLKHHYNVLSSASFNQCMPMYITSTWCSNVTTVTVFVIWSCRNTRRDPNQLFPAVTQEKTCG